jgi:hypothetical protein
MTTNNTPPNGQAAWWRSGPAMLSLMISTALAAALGWLTGINNRLDAHSQRIQTLEVQGVQQGKQLDRIENKLDQLREHQRRSRPRGDQEP